MTDNTSAPPPAPRQSSAEAERFIAALGRGQPLLFRLLPESGGREGKRGHQPIQLIGTFQEHAQDLRRYNDAGLGVFMQANASDGKGGRTANIVSATCLFADFDGVPLENVERLALSPHVTVETSPGKRHFYWRVDSIPLAEFSGLQKRLIRLFDSDKAIHDLPRIMRLPGFLHQKNPDEPHLVRVREASETGPYTLDAFMTALDDAENAHGVATQAQRKRLPTIVAAPLAAAANVTRDLFVAESALRHSISTGTVDLGERNEWVRVGMALKASIGEEGFDLWVRLSSEADGFKDEDDCRKQWDSFKDDLPEGKRLTIATFIANAAYTGWKIPSAIGGSRRVSAAGPGADGSIPMPVDSDEGNGSGRGRGKPDDATVAIIQARAAGDEFFIDKDRQPHVRFRRRADDDKAPWRVARLDSEAYRDTMRRRFHQEAVTKMLPKEQLGNALDLLAAEAREKQEERTIHLRSGMHGGKLYVDLGRGDGMVMEVDGDGWRVKPDSPVLFVEGSRGALPFPETGGSIEMLAKHTPSLDRWGVQRVLAFCVSVFNPAGARTMLLFTGERGTNKSTLEDMTLALIDPPTGRQDGRFSFSNEERDLVIHALHNAVLSFDNLSSFSNREADWVCKLLTGTAFHIRKLYSNIEGQSFALKRPIVGTGIGTPSSRSDFLDRLLPVETLVGSQRRTEEAVWEDFERDHAKLFGLVLTGVSHSLRARSLAGGAVKGGASNSVRLADVAAFVEGANEVLGLAPGEFTARLRGEQGSLQGEAVAGDPVGEALISYFSVPGNKPIDCTATELLTLLTNGVRERDRGWPNKFKARSHFERIAGGLRQHGISVEFRKDPARNQWMVRVTAMETFHASSLTDSEYF